MMHKLLREGAAALVAITAVTFASAQQCDKTDYDCKIRSYRAQIAADPNNAEAYYGLALALQSKLDYAGSIPPLDRYIASGVSNKGYLADGYHLRAYANYKLGNHERAVADYGQAIQLLPDKQTYYYERGRSLNVLERFVESVADLTKAISLDATDSSAFFQRGYAYMSQKDYPPAISDFNRVMVLDPKESEAYYNRGTIYYRQQKYALAITDLSKYIEMNKAAKDKLADGYFNRGLTYDVLGNQQKAIADFSSAIALEPTLKKAYEARARSYRKIKNIPLAVADENKAATLNP